MTRCLLTICLLAPQGAGLFGHTTLSPAQLLATARGAVSVKMEDKKSQYLSDHQRDLPWINELEVRTESNEFDWQQQEIAFRLQPNSKRSRQAQRQLQLAQGLRQNAQTQLALRKALKERYDLLVDHYFLPNLIGLHQQLQLIHQDRIYLAQSPGNSRQLDVKALIASETDLHRENLQVLKLQQALDQNQYWLQQYTQRSDSLQMDRSELLNVQQVMALLGSANDSLLQQHPLLAEKQSRQQVLQREYELEEARSAAQFNFLQAKYGGRNRDNFNEGFSIGAGFRLPFRGKDQLDLDELKLEKWEEGQEIRQTTHRLSLEKELLQYQMQQQYRSLRVLTQQLATSPARQAIEQMGQIQGLDAETLLLAKELLLEQELQILEHRYKIFRQYVDWLDISHVMTSQPLRNHLSAGAETF
ncbi:MAG: hypothetical protein AAFV25_05585, partial [Bacteroidota bacterium]